MNKTTSVSRIIGALTCVLCVLGLVGMGLGSVQAADDFGFGKDGSIDATADVTIGGMGSNGGGSIKRDDAALDVVRGGINRVLGIMALIALGFVLFGGIKMATARGEEGPYTDGLKIAQRALLGLVLIGVARFIISAIFRLMNVSGEAAQGTSAGTDK